MDEFAGHGQGLAQTFISTVGSRDPAGWAAMFTEDATYLTPDRPDAFQGRPALKAMAETLFTAIPDMVFMVRSITEQGNVVVLEGATKGTFTGPMRTDAGEVPPTGKSYETPFAAVFEVTDAGLIKACREYYDTAAFATQLGLAG
ncbi:nuclear transport factor 2 family protein [Pseudarthrobacter sp. NPDC089323]